MSTLSELVTTLRTGLSETIPASQINYGVADNLSPPYVSVLDFEQTFDYQTCGLAVQKATWRVVVVAKSCDEAEALTTITNSFLELQSPTSKGGKCLRLSYKVGQYPERLYQFVTESIYELQESVI